MIGSKNFVLYMNLSKLCIQAHSIYFDCALSLTPSSYPDLSHINYWQSHKVPLSLVLSLLVPDSSCSTNTQPSLTDLGNSCHSDLIWRHSSFRKPRTTYKGLGTTSKWCSNTQLAYCHGITTVIEMSFLFFYCFNWQLASLFIVTQSYYYGQVSSRLIPATLETYQNPATMLGTRYWSVQYSWNSCINEPLYCTEERQKIDI